MNTWDSAHTDAAKKEYLLRLLKNATEPLTTARIAFMLNEKLYRDYESDRDPHSWVLFKADIAYLLSHLHKDGKLNKEKRFFRNYWMPSDDER